MNEVKALKITLNSFEFAKEFVYFITLSIDSTNTKYKTDHSSPSNNPIFTINSFVLPLNSIDNVIDADQRIHIAAFVVTDRVEYIGSELQNKGQAKLLGECVVEVQSIIPTLADIGPTGMKKLLKFTRIQNDKEVTVGRFVADFALVGNYQFPQSLISKGNEDKSNEEGTDFFEDFKFHKWRLRIELRSAVNIPVNLTGPSGFPSSFVEFGWSLYRQEKPNAKDIINSKIVDNSQHPIYNQTIIFANPTESVSPGGCLWISLKDKNVILPIATTIIPISGLTPFHQLHLDLVGRVDETTKSHLYISLTLELPPEVYSDRIAVISVNSLQFDPLPISTNSAMIMLTTNGFKPSKLPFIPIEMHDEASVSLGIESLEKNTQIFLSKEIKIPQDPLSQITLSSFLIQRKDLNSPLQVFLVLKDEQEPNIHQLPNVISGFSDFINNDLLALFNSNTRENMQFPISYYNTTRLYKSISSLKCTLKLSSYPLGIVPEPSKKIIQDEEKTNVNQKLIEGFQSVLPKEEWQSYSRELAQKQELINRVMKELDERKQALKLTGAEIIDLRRTIKLMQSENAILRQRLGEEEKVELLNKISKEINKMPNDELKNKLLKVSQAYRAERLRNEEFEKAIKAAQFEIASSKKIEAQLESLQLSHQEKSRKLIEMQKEIQKINLYKDTVLKQEKVIEKLELLLSKSVNDSKKLKGDLLELEKLKTENLQLQKQLKDNVPSKYQTSNEVDKYRAEISRLEETIAQLKEQKFTGDRALNVNENPEWENEKIEFEVNLNKANTRIKAIEEQMQNNAKLYGKEIARLKGIIAEKESIINETSIRKEEDNIE